jgi:alkyl hydroperoxide reductase subunit D
MTWVEQLSENLPRYAKDIKLNLEVVINRSTIDPEHAMYLSIAAAVSTGNSKLLTFILANATDEVEREAALYAGAIMAQNNIWYPYLEMAGDQNLKGLPAQLRMNGIGTHGGTTKAKFEAYCLASSIIGKCHFCVKAHYETLKEEGYSVEQLRDIGRIAATINALAKILTA